MRLEPCILGTACLPWNPDFTLAEEIFRREIQSLLAHGLKDLYLFGTAGEGHAVTDRQFRRAGEIFFEETRSGSGLRQLGIIAQSVSQVRERIEIGLAIGFRFFQISLPSWGRLNDREMFGFFDQILGSYPQVRFLHYNILRGLRKLTGKEYARIAGDHPNLVATKSGGRNIGEDLGFMVHAPELCHFFTELDFAYASLFGPCGLLVSISALDFEKARMLFSAGQKKDSAALVSFSLQIQKMLALIFAACRSGQHMDGAFDKIYCKSRLAEFPLRLLPPYQGSSDEEFEEFMKGFKGLR
jgi:dihydrodipicolinate synthase/N-acetylneuraminate lyase